MIPGCPQMTSAGNQYRPFCSERCKLIDLSNWISETYRVPQTNADDEEDVDLLFRKDLDEE
jgi:uncharacterized protein